MSSLENLGIKHPFTSSLKTSEIKHLEKQYHVHRCAWCNFLFWGGRVRIFAFFLTWEISFSHIIQGIFVFINGPNLLNFELKKSPNFYNRFEHSAGSNKKKFSFFNLLIWQRRRRYIIWKNTFYTGKTHFSNPSHCKTPHPKQNHWHDELFSSNFALN